MIQETKLLEGVKAIDLFAGIGGFHLALESFGVEIIYASEWDKKATETYERNFNLKPAGDITKINEKDVPAHDILCAGFPCQAFSISGKQLGFADSRGTLFFDVARIAKEKQPKILFLENVKNLAVHDGGKTFRVIMNTLDEIGYSPYASVLNGADYGIPQSRKRIYIVAFRKDLGIINFAFPEKIPLKKHVKDILLDDSETEKYVIKRKDIKMSGNTDSEEADKPLRIGTVNKGGQGERIYSPNGTAITLSAYGGGIGAKTGLYLINGKIRRLAPRECARLQGFPDSFILDDNDNVVYKQMGNSVIVDVLQRIIENVVSTIVEI